MQTATLPSKALQINDLNGIKAVVKKSLLKHINQDKEDLQFWLSKTVKERAAAVTSIIRQSLTPGQRLDKSFVLKKLIQRLD